MEKDRGSWDRGSGSQEKTKDVGGGKKMDRECRVGLPT